MDVNEFFADQDSKQSNPRRKSRDYRKENLKTYAILGSIGLLVVLFIIFAIGSVRRSNARREAARQESLAAQESAVAMQSAWDAEAQALYEQAAAMAAGYDYDGAAELIAGFSGELYEYDALMDLLDDCAAQKERLVPWSDPNQIVNLSFNLLIADPDRAFANEQYKDSFYRNFITVSEFTSILTQLYENGYVLVDLDDFLEVTTAESGVNAFTYKPLLLPEGKKPLVLTQTHVNYNTYMTDGDGDGLPDKQGSGFASRLVLDKNGALTCELVDKNGNTVTGAYDMVPILNTFIKSHPDFSYRGARAIVAVSGYDGLFGYRTDPETAQKISPEFYEQQLKQVPAIIDALRRDGYTIACYTYENIAYGAVSTQRVLSDLASWQKEVEPLLGKVNVLVYAKNSDLEDYAGEKFQALTQAGFQYFLGICDSKDPWLQLNSSYVRQGRLLINGTYLDRNPHFYTGLFDPTAVKDPSR